MFKYFNILLSFLSNIKIKTKSSIFIYGTSKQEDGFINVNTTLPVINNELPVITTDRLIIRGPAYSDIYNYYSLRSQPEAMVDSGRGKPDSDIFVTLNKLERLINGDKNNVYFFIFLKNSDGTEGDLIGDGESVGNRCSRIAVAHRTLTRTSAYP